MKSLPVSSERAVARFRTWVAFASLFAVLLCSATSLAHPLAPTGFHVTETQSGDQTADDQLSPVQECKVEVRWRTPRQTPIGERLRPVFPEACQIDSRTTPEDTPLAMTDVLTLTCGVPFDELTFAVDGIAGATTNVVYSVTDINGDSFSGLLSREPATFSTRATSSANASRSGFKHFFKYGVEHLLIGIDHVLFLLGLLILVRSALTLVSAVTAFTIGHGVSLAVTVLTPFSAPGPPIELGIALSLVVLAVRILKEDEQGLPPWTGRQAAGLCAAFGLLHGLGLAGAFLETGIPRDGILPAMLGFNLGVEAGQLIVIAAVLVIRPLIMNLIGEHRTRYIAAYAIGIAATFWGLERLVGSIMWLAG